MAESAEQAADIKASEAALDQLTTAAQNHPDPPLEHIHAGADHQKSHAWIQKYLPQSLIDEYECSYHMGNYVIDRKSGQKSFEQMSIYVRMGMHLLYYGSYQAYLLQSGRVMKLLEAQSAKMGKQYDAPESIAHIKPFIDSFDLWDSMSEMVKPNIEDYATFNDFFAREIKLSARPVDEPDNDLVTSSPADCRMVVFPTIDLATKYWIKGFGFTLEKLLGSPELASDFDGGSIVIARLAPQDYHRWHAPVSGTVENLKKIPGAYYTVNPQAITQSTTLDVFCENRRDVMTVKRDSTGSKIVIIAVGAMLVGSIVWNEGFETPGKTFKRGECQGSFRYGGSTVIVLYPKDEVVFDDDLVKHSTEMKLETLMKCNWRTGIKQ